jgi:hypothetical protein
MLALSNPLKHSTYLYEPPALAFKESTFCSRSEVCVSCNLAIKNDDFPRQHNRLLVLVVAHCVSREVGN